MQAPGGETPDQLQPVGHAAHRQHTVGGDAVNLRQTRGQGVGVGGIAIQTVAAGDQRRKGGGQAHVKALAIVLLPVGEGGTRAPERKAIRFLRGG